MDSQSEYFLMLAVLEKSPALIITEDDYKEIIAARQTLSAALSFEEKYDQVLGNFLDLEKDLLMLTIDKVVDHRFDYSRAYTVSATLNRRIVNFVLSGKNYTELISSKASKCVSNSNEVATEITKLTNELYESSSDYRFMEALRNHISHSGLAVHVVESPDRWLLDENQQATNLVFNISIFSLRERLAENDGFKRSVLKELAEKTDLKKATRSYVGAISSIQEKVRELTKQSIADARSVIEKHIKNYEKINNGDAFPLGCYSSDSFKGEPDTSVMLFLNWDDVRIGLTKKNRSISNMEKRYVSSAIADSYKPKQ